MNVPGEDASTARVALDLSGAVATLTLTRPPMNAIDDAMLRALADAFDRVEAVPGIALLRLRSDQRVFCAGADLRLVSERVGSEAGAEAMVETVRLFHQVFGRLATLPVVTLAEIEGHALGGGLELALACDLRIAAHQAKLGLPEAKVGLLPGAGGTQRLTRLCGPGAAARIILSGELIDGREAERVGLVQWAADAADFAEAAAGITSRIAGLSVDALRLAKHCIGIAARVEPEGILAEVDGIGMLMRNSGTAQRVAQFLQR